VSPARPRRWPCLRGFLLVLMIGGGPGLAETTRRPRHPAGAGGDACPAGALVARAARPSVLARTARVEPDRPGVHGAVQLVRLGQIV